MNNNEHQVNFASHNDNNNFVRKTWGWGGTFLVIVSQLFV